MHWPFSEGDVQTAGVSTLFGPLLARSIGLAAMIGLALLGAAYFWG